MSDGEERLMVPGIPDDMFARGSVPMTKAEIRTIVLSKLRLEQDSVVWDVGAGTGSITVEAALTAARGRVYAVECRPEAVELIRSNQRKFAVNNLSIVAGRAPEALLALPSPDRVVIGGSGGELAAILEVVKNRLCPAGVVVLTCATVETLYHSLNCLREMGFQGIEGVGVTITRLKSQGRYHMLEGLNPVFIVSGVQPT